MSQQKYKCECEKCSCHNDGVFLKSQGRNLCSDCYLGMHQS